MTDSNLNFWAKTLLDGRPGISVRDHCCNVGCVAEALIDTMTPNVRHLLPSGAATLAALHDVGKITIGFQAKCPQWLTATDIPPCSRGDIALSVSDHALVSQVLLQNLPNSAALRLWSVAVGAHHGRPKGKSARSSGPEVLQEWAESYRMGLLEELCAAFGPLPTIPPDDRLKPYHSDLWLLAGLITVADWIGSNEIWFSPEKESPADATRQQARVALRQIGWPGGKLRLTGFAAAFATGPDVAFNPNPLQQAVADAARIPGVIVVEGPMGCGKTEAALFAAQQLIASGRHQGIYFALPTQVTSNRIHLRVERFLRNTLADKAAFRLAHGNAWLEDDFDLRVSPAFERWEAKDGEKPSDHIREARSWFASAKQALLAPYGVGTIDQALQGVVAVKHFFVRRFALAGKVVILDEIHSYDIYTGTLITALIRELVNLRCSVIILSATLTVDRRRELLQAAGIRETTSPTSYPLVTSGSSGAEAHHVSPAWSSHRTVTLRPAVIPDEEVIDELITRAESGQHVLWIRNTVIEAQQSFRAVAGSVRQGSLRLGLLHSRFPFKHRDEHEKDWLEHLGRNRPASGPGSILIATQVVEQSVDIDLDFIVSDLAPTDMLLQRMGRLWRHDRPHRHAAKPEFWIRLPEISPESDAMALKKSLGRSTWVYAPYVLLRTSAVWRQKSEITLPADIRPVLEATYAVPDASEPIAWQELHADLEKDKSTLAANALAATLVLGRPMLNDQDDVLTRRRGAPTTPVVLLRSVTTGTNGSVVLQTLDDEKDETSEYEWHRKPARLIHYWVVRAPRWMVPADAPKPRWLDLLGPAGATVATVRDDGRCVFGDQISSVTYDPRLGIYADRSPQTTPQWKDDDEFDS